MKTYHEHVVAQASSRQTGCLRSLRRHETGAALAETALTIMTFLIIILGIVQISLAINAKLLVNYAAYCAARAGIVHNGEQAQMENAAALTLSPLFTGSADFAGVAQGYGRAHLELLKGNLPFTGLRVEILSPGPERFREDYKKRFFPELQRYGEPPQDQNFLDDNLLVVRVTYYYPLRIPVINTLLSPFFKNVKLTSVHRMRMQSDAFTQRNRSIS